MIECSVQNCASILPQLGMRVTVYDRVGGWVGEEDHGLEKWARTRSWRSPREILQCLPFVLKAMGWPQMGLKQAQDKRIQCIYWNVYIGKITKYIIICSVYTVKDSKGHRVIRPVLT